jgi:hypothetical protein
MIYAPDATTRPEERRGWRRSSQRSWAEDADIYQPRAKTIRDVRKQGNTFVGKTSRTNTMWGIF